MQVKILTKSVSAVERVANRWFVEFDVLPEHGSRFTRSAEVTATTGALNAIDLAFEAVRDDIERKVLSVIKTDEALVGREIKNQFTAALHDKIKVAEDLKRERAIEAKNNKQLAGQNREEP